MPPRLELIRSADPTEAPPPNRLAADVCGEICSAVDDSVTIEDALRSVLAIVCRAKAKGPGNVAVFDESMHVSARETLELESDLRRALDRDELMVHLQPILAESALDPRMLQLEVTETTLVEQGEGAIRVLNALRERGIRIAMDDFGTGYSSLSYLHRFPIDAIKLDQSFVRALPEDGRIAHIVQAVVTLGRNLGMEIIAEGVESEAQARLLRELGCDCAQGFLYAAAMSPGKAAAMLHAPRERAPRPDRGAPRCESSL